METVKKVVCVGDSITYGETLTDVALESYPSRLGEMLGKGYSVEGCGRSGAGLWHRGFFPYATTPEFQRAVSIGADVIIVCLGTNDLIYPAGDAFGEEFVEDYGKLLDALRSRSPQDARLFVAQVPPVPQLFGDDACSPVVRLNGLIATVAEHSGASLIDLYGPFAGHRELFSDGVHPNREGALLIAGKVFMAVTRSGR